MVVSHATESAPRIMAERMVLNNDGNTFADLSGAMSSTSDNPYDALIEACENDLVRYALEFREFIID